MFRSEPHSRKCIWLDKFYIDVTVNSEDIGHQYVLCKQINAFGIWGYINVTFPNSVLILVAGISVINSI